MPTFENVYEVRMITDAEDADWAREIQEQELGQIAYGWYFISGDSA